MTKRPKNYEPPLHLDMDLNEALERIAQTDPEELDMESKKISKLPAKPGSKELDPKQGELPFKVERQTEIDGIGMGVLKDGTAFLTGRGLARLVGIENLHIRTISQQWNDDPPKPRIAGIKAILDRVGVSAPMAHIETTDGSRTIHAFPDSVCLAVLEYYAFDADKPREAARDNYRILAGKALQELIYSQVGYDPTGRYQDRFAKWHERIELNHQSAPKGYFSVFNEAHTIIYEMIQAGAEVGDKTVVDISIGQHWSKYWDGNGLAKEYGARQKWPHRYPDSHPQANSNPQEAWCYPISALGAYREWLQDEYIEGGKFAKYIDGKAKKGDLPPSIAQLAISAVEQKALPSPE